MTESYGPNRAVRMMIDAFESKHAVQLPHREELIDAFAALLSFRELAAARHRDDPA